MGRCDLILTMAVTFLLVWQNRISFPPDCGIVWRISSAKSSVLASSLEREFWGFWRGGRDGALCGGAVMANRSWHLAYRARGEVGMGEGHWQCFFNQAVGRVGLPSRRRKRRCGRCARVAAGFEGSVSFWVVWQALRRTGENRSPSWRVDSGFRRNDEKSGGVSF